MFTGIIEETGVIKNIARGRHSAVLDIYADKVMKGTRLGDSIAVNGVCLTVTSMGSGHFTVDVMPETMDRTSLGKLSSGSSVNLERAMMAGGRFGGHMVSGHGDACCKVGSVEEDDNAVLMKVAVPEEISRFIALKGSVTIDGISLTVMSVGKGTFTVSLIPHTRKSTTLESVRQGNYVNIEVDMLARYVDRLLSSGSGTDTDAACSSGTASDSGQDRKKQGLSLEFLKENGF